MNTLLSMLKWDIRLQFRYGFYAVYTILTAVFVLGLQLIGPGLRTDAAVLLIVTDPTVLGFYFIASIVLFEKREGVLDALVASPLGDRGYLASKVITLSLLAVVASTLVAVLGHGSIQTLWVLVVGISLSASLFVLLGFVAVARFNTINQYFISAAGWGTVLFLPLFGYVGFIDTWFFYLLPAQPVLILVEGGFRSIAMWQVAYGIGYLTLGNAVAFVWARRVFRRHIVRGGDPGHQLGHAENPDRQHHNNQRWSEPRSPVVGLVLTDLRNWVRDPMLAVAAVGPLILAVIIRFGAPTVAEMAAPAILFKPYFPTITGSMAVFGPSLYGFIVGMFILEDREQGVLTAYRVSPLSTRGYLLYRSGTAYALSLGATLPALAVIGLIPIQPAVLVGVAGVGALGGPLVALGFGTFASNTIEGLALSKLINLIILGPAVIVALVSEPFEFAAGLLPTYWPVKAFVAGTAEGSLWLVFLLLGAVSHLFALAVFGWLFAQRAD